MKSVQDHENTIVIKNSKFICLLYYIEKKEDILKKINETKIKYPNATHYCYAYILDHEKKETDDGEPAGTAGIPILQVLEKNDLNHVLCIVVRYFGKIKLGASGLIRAYTKSVVECLKEHIIILENGYYISLIFSYEHLKLVNYLLKDVFIIDKEYGKQIIYQLSVTRELLEKLNQIDGITLKVHHSVYVFSKKCN